MWSLSTLPGDSSSQTIHLTSRNLSLADTSTSAFLQCILRPSIVNGVSRRANMNDALINTLDDMEYKLEPTDDIFSFFNSDDTPDGMSESNSDFSGISPFSSPLRSDSADYMLIKGSPEQPELDTKQLDYMDEIDLLQIPPVIELHPSTFTQLPPTPVVKPIPAATPKNTTPSVVVPPPVTIVPTSNRKVASKKAIPATPLRVGTNPIKVNRKMETPSTAVKKKLNNNMTPPTTATPPPAVVNKAASKGPLSLSREDLLQLTSKAFENYIRQVVAVRKLSQDELDQLKKQRRLIKNRESAQLSRNRKKVHVDEIETKLNALTAERDAALKQLSVVAAERDRLKMEVMALKSRHSTESGLSSVQSDANELIATASDVKNIFLGPNIAWGWEGGKGGREGKLVCNFDSTDK
ncbi:hypothetical protein PROFUN_10795 [Planoprotostelium fungivorum]|uniref:BZIP domain-containing protein n=1 Tax=Planoprotostelium fungivorum TaxID=1890364 RepID=A0A2P6NCX0_9EUKA|nr:hypothetical protein PROFUN_10795 [Planoprotostelium fungivorum]